jgi:hypothetical protein
MGIRIFRCCGRRIDPHIIGYRDHFINTWIIAQANGSLTAATLLKLTLIKMPGLITKPGIFVSAKKSFFFLSS